MRDDELPIQNVESGHHFVIVRWPNVVPPQTGRENHSLADIPLVLPIQAPPVDSLVRSGTPDPGRIGVENTEQKTGRTKSGSGPAVASCAVPFCVKAVPEPQPSSKVWMW